MVGLSQTEPYHRRWGKSNTIRRQFLAVLSRHGTTAVWLFLCSCLLAIPLRCITAQDSDTTDEGLVLGTIQPRQFQPLIRHSFQRVLQCQQGHSVRFRNQILEFSRYIPGCKDIFQIVLPLTGRTGLSAPRKPRKAVGQYLRQFLYSTVVFHAHPSTAVTFQRYSG